MPVISPLMPVPQDPA